MNETQQAQLVLSNTALTTALRLLLGALTECDAITPLAMKAKLGPALGLATKVIGVAKNATEADLRAIVEATKPATGVIQ